MFAALDITACRGPVRDTARVRVESLDSSRRTGLLTRPPRPSIRSRQELSNKAKGSQDSDGQPNSILKDLDDVPNGTQPFKKNAARIFAAVAMTSGALELPTIVAPPPVHAASTTNQKTPSEEKGSFLENLNPNLIKLPDSVSEKIDASMVNVGKSISAVANGIKKQAQDPWSVEDVWVIIALNWLIKNGRRKVFDIVNATSDDDSTDEEKITKQFDASVFGWLTGPLKALNLTWIFLYLHDNASRMFDPLSSLDGGYFGYAFDLGMYTLMAGAVLVMSTQRWLPAILHEKLKIEEISLQTVITRLAVIAIAVVSTLRAGLLFGVPYSSIIGVGGVGGLTFGLAARDVLSNVMGGTMLAVLRPFKVGEEIFVTQGSNFRGSDDPTVSDYLVKEIGWYQTTLEAKDTKPTIVPNGYFLGANVINVTRAVARVLILQFRILYRDRKTIPGLCKDIEEFLRKDSAISSQKYPVRVNLAAAKEDCLTIGIECHVYKMPLDKHLSERARLIYDMLDIVEEKTTGTAYPTEITLEHSIGKYPVNHGAV
tara:strand:- start:10697 stop:12322 length:1626 start_codon:yes stop_codon:yes gene_type:complete